MIIGKSPLRISYIGGGSDVPSYFCNQPSYVVGTTIDKFVYTSVNALQEFAEQKIRVTYRQVESVSKIDQISHPIVREILRYLNWNQPINIATLADLPGNSGLGSSSAFTVSLISAMNLAGNLEMTPDQIAMLAIHIEREVLQEAGGVQDQFHSTVGGFRMYRFSSDGHTYSNSLIDDQQSEYISDRQWIYPVGGLRSSSDAHKKIINSRGKDYTPDANIDNLSKSAHSFFKAITESKLKPSELYSQLTNAVKTSWALKSRQNQVTSSAIDSIIAEFYVAGAHAVKLCGAGQSGYLLILAEPEIIDRLPRSVRKERILNARIEPNGCKTFQL
jgi:D-glycero-alpha-D-manno-heptose-7-phosphate kinase